MPQMDAADPFEDERGHAKRKLRQLCRQVERVLVTALADREEAVIRELALVEVLPWPNASRLLAVVAPADEHSEVPRQDGVVDRPEVIKALEEVKVDLREIIAQRINRKRAPELCFEVMATASNPFAAALPDALD